MEKYGTPQDSITINGKIKIASEKIKECCRKALLEDLTRVVCDTCGNIIQEDV